METTQALPDIIMHIPGDLAEHVSLSGIVHQRMVQSAVAAALVDANATIKTLQEAAKAKDFAYDVLSTDCGAALDENRTLSKLNEEQAEQIDTLLLRIAKLEGTPLPIVVTPDKPPVVEPPVAGAVKPIITKTELRNVAGYCITLGENAPSAGVDATARNLIVMGEGMGMNCVRFYRNPDEVRADVKRTPDDLRNLYSFSRKHGMVVVADTVDSVVLELNDTELKDYADGIKKLGAVLVVFNDANQFRGNRKDGTPYPAGTLEKMVARWRAVSDLPIMASVTAGAKIEDYKPLFDFVEAQTFGKPAELDQFLDRGFDAYCLDGQASASLDYLRKAHDIILKDNPVAVWWYSAWDEKTLWTSMLDKTPLIEKTMKALTAQWSKAPAVVVK